MKFISIDFETHPHDSSKNRFRTLEELVPVIVPYMRDCSFPITLYSNQKLKEVLNNLLTEGSELT
jgi:hypothetical protein